MESTDVSEYSVPDDLPVAEAPLTDIFLGTGPLGLSTADEMDETLIDDLTHLEDVAHAEETLVSSDALRFISTKVALEEQETLLLNLIKRAKRSFPQEDGWLILNLDRIQSLYDGEVEALMPEQHEIDPDLMPSGSLAEAILMGDTMSAFALIDHRPMVALAAAAADLDALYRMRLGEEGAETNASELLKREAMNLPTEQLTNVIKALTSALDGTYTSEESAVKMAVLKAIKVLSE
ncbi:hypothetical protein H6783_02425 [Candidatus Nomurabacteria bacterium]|nr:hypothetical protein [Candidatus Nomurabacteria bacterium]